MEPVQSIRLVGSTTSLGIFCVTGAVVSFSTNDMLVKWLSGDYLLHQIVLIRSIFALLVTLAVFSPLEGGPNNLRTRRLGLHLLNAARGWVRQ